MANRIASIHVHAGIYRMEIYAIILPSSWFSVAHSNKNFYSILIFQIQKCDKQREETQFCTVEIHVDCCHGNINWGQHFRIFTHQGSLHETLVCIFQQNLLDRDFHEHFRKWSSFSKICKRKSIQNQNISCINKTRQNYSFYKNKSLICYSF